MPCRLLPALLLIIDAAIRAASAPRYYAAAFDFRHYRRCALMPCRFSLMPSMIALITLLFSLPLACYQRNDAGLIFAAASALFAIFAMPARCCYTPPLRLFLPPLILFAMMLRCFR